MLANVEYEDYLSSQKTDISSIGFNLSQMSSTGPSSDNSEATVQLKYSRRTRRKARKSMPRQHVLEHQNDVSGILKCHNIKDREAMGRTFVFALLWLALNQINDSLQIGDLIRYAEESHIKSNNISSFLPPNVDTKHATNQYRKGLTTKLSHYSVRNKALLLAQAINIREIRMPNMGDLCERYLKDLSLPSDMSDMIKCLLAFHPPEMKTKNSCSLTRSVPNYEGRAMAYVIFMLKLLFGVDDQREHDISTSAIALNKALDEADAKEHRLFVWSEWVEYVKMRNTILSQCHYPTAMQIDPNANMHTDMYIDFLKRSNEDGECDELYRKIEMENIRVVFDQIVRLHQEHDSQKAKPSCSFEPSHTPFSSYMDSIRTDRSIKSKVYIPEFMSVNHEARDIVAYLKPNKLRQTFHPYGTHLNVSEVPYNKRIQYAYVSFKNTKITANVAFRFDVTKDEWIDEMRQRDNELCKAKREAELRHSARIADDVATHLERLRYKQWLKQSKRKSNAADANNVDGNGYELNNHNSSQLYDNNGDDDDQNDDDKWIDAIISEPRRNLDNQPNMLNYESTDDEEEIDCTKDCASLEFLVSNFDYWIAMENIYYITNNSFNETMTGLPLSFQWLLEQCALQIRQNTKDLYIELLAIENEFRYVLKPVFKMTNYVEYRKRTGTNLHTQTLNASNLLRRIW